MGKSACPVDEKKRHKFLHDHGFHFLRTGKGSHQIWAHKESGDTITLCGNPAKGTWRHVEKQVQEIAQKQEARVKTAPAQQQDQQKTDKPSLFEAFKRAAKKEYLATKTVHLTYGQFRKQQQFKTI